MLSHAVTPTPYTIESIAFKSPTHTSPSHYRQQNRGHTSSAQLNIASLTLLETCGLPTVTCPGLLSQSSKRRLFSLRRILFLRSLSSVIEKGKNVSLVRVLFRFRALNWAAYHDPYVTHNGTDTSTGCSITCPPRGCQAFYTSLQIFPKSHPKMS